MLGELNFPYNKPTTIKKVTQEQKTKIKTSQIVMTSQGGGVPEWNILLITNTTTTTKIITLQVLRLIKRNPF